MHKFSLDADKCISCGSCVKDCLFAVLELVDGHPVYAKAELCIGCLHCYAICPVGAITMDDYDPARALPLAKTPYTEEVEAFIRQRRSIRAFKQENIQPDLLRRLLETTWSAPSGVNQHLLQISVIDNIKEMDVFKKYIYRKIDKLGQDGALDARLFAYLGPTREDWLKNDVIFRHAPHLIAVSCTKNAATGIPDCFIYLAYLEMLAHAFNIGTLWCGLAYKVFQLLADAKQLLGVPKDYEIGYVMLLGKPAVHYARGLERRNARIHMVGQHGASDSL